MELRKEDITVLRTLAQQYMEYASLSIQDEKKSLWKNLNQLRMQKPMVYIDQMPWNELDVDGSLQCCVSDPYFREVERSLRRQLYRWKYMPVDMVMSPYILIPHCTSDTGYGLHRKAETRSIDEKNDVKAYKFEDLLRDYEDLEKIQTPKLTVDRKQDAEHLSAAQHIFDGIAPVKFSGITMHLGYWDFITQLRGIENCFIDLLDRPEFMHSIMDKLTNAALGLIEQINAEGVYDVNSHLCHCNYTYLDDIPSSDADCAHPVTQDGWAFGLAQLFSSVSPDITEEFEVPYMQRLFPHFGAIYYGCCEKLDDRLDVVAKMPNIRKVSCSPWSDRDHFAACLPKTYVMSNKPNPAFLAAEIFDEDAIRADLRHTIRAAQENGLCLELILKDISTVKYEPQRLWRWAQIAEEETLRAAL